jgi:hypothetical protein
MSSYSLHPCFQTLSIIVISFLGSLTTLHLTTFKIVNLDLNQAHKIVNLDLNQAHKIINLDLNQAHKIINLDLNQAHKIDT